MLKTLTVLYFQAKDQLHKAIEDFVRERIILAAQGISTEAATKIANRDIIVVYSWYPFSCHFS